MTTIYVLSPILKIHSVTYIYISYHLEHNSQFHQFIERMAKETKHILMFPFMGEAHILPFLELAKRLHVCTPFTITILTSPLNAKFIHQNLLPTNTLQIEELPSSDYELQQPNVENTQKLPPSPFLSLVKTITSLESQLQNYLSQHFTPGEPPLCIIYDFLMGWVAPVAKNFGSFGVAFAPSSAYGTSAFISLWTHLPHRNISEDQHFLLPGFPENQRFHISQIFQAERLADGSDDRSRFFQSQFEFLKKSSGWICNSTEKIEPLGFQIFRNYVKLPVWGMGPLATPPINNDNECVQWLNEQKANSVLYISFGSQNTISLTQMMELAAGIELSEKPFLWVIRPPARFDINGEFKDEWLPEGFDKRMKEKKQGILVHKWAPQLQILSHKSTGAFLSQCGWSSILEGLSQGVPMIGWPLAAEQAFISKVLVEQMEVAVELTRGLEGQVTKEDVKRIVNLVLEKREGSCGWKIKKKVDEMQENLGDVVVREDIKYKSSSFKGMNDFVHAILSFR